MSVRIIVGTPDAGLNELYYVYTIIPAISQEFCPHIFNVRIPIRVMEGP